MITYTSWQSVAHAFKWDGSWRDIYILNTSSKDWDVVIEALNRGDYGFKFFCDGDLWIKALPSFTDIMLMQEHCGVTSSFTIAGMIIKCHFFTDDTIEFDLDPREVTANNWQALCDFLFELSRIIHKPCRLTEENCPDLRYIEVDASKEKMEFFQFDVSEF